MSVSLSEVPSLNDTAYICVDLPRDDVNIRRQLTEAIREYGRVMSRPPVQITDIAHRPAALLVHWAELSTAANGTNWTEVSTNAASGTNNMDSTDVLGSEFNVYRLQICCGKVSAIDSDAMTPSFRDVYQGPSTSYLVTSLERNVQYTLRVCGGSCDGGGAAAWSAWSLPVTWATSLPRRRMYV